MGRIPKSFLISLPLSVLCLAAAAPADAAPRKHPAKPGPSYLLELKPAKLESGVTVEHGVPLASALHSKLGQSHALSLRFADDEPLQDRALRRHLTRRRLAGLSAVPTATCEVSQQSGNRTVVRCKVRLLLMSLRQRNLISAYSCEAQVESRRPSAPPSFIDRMRRDVLAAAAEGVAEDLTAFLESNSPGSGRLPRRGR